MNIDTRALKVVAIIGLVLAIGAVAHGVRAMLAAGDILGPSGLVVTPAGDVWIGVDQQLWRASPDGQLVEMAATAALGLPGAPANLVRHPDGSIVATVRDDPALYMLDSASARVVRTLRPQWPEVLARHAGRAINLAFHADGRFAVATGGGHAVALFDPEGRFLARTASDSYRFTNGLWWVGDALWTTDTNRFSLRRLDGRSLELRESVALPSDGDAVFVAAARVHPQVASGSAQMAALTRLRNGMITGRVVAISPDGLQREYPHPGLLEPRDLDWHDGHLLLTDGESFSVLRWSAEHRPMPPFGDDTLQATLRQRAAERDRLGAEYRQGLFVGIALFALAFALALRAHVLERRDAHRRRTLDLARLGTPEVDGRRLAAQALRVHGPMFAFMLVALALAWAPGGPLSFGGGKAATWGVLLGLMLVVTLALLITLRRLHRLGRSPAYEPLFNQMAMRKLRSGALDLALLDGEHVLETFTMQGQVMRWVVLTDERLLIFASTFTDHRLEAAYTLAQIVGASNEPGALRPSRIARGFRWCAPGGWIEIALRDGGVLCGRVSAPTVAERVVKHLTAHAGQARTTSRPRRSAAPTPNNGMPPAWAAFGSALIPGFGQWAQRRRAAALLTFVPWLSLTLFVTIPLIWTVAGPRAGVSPKWILMVAGSHVVMSVLAAADAWRMGQRPVR
ncbi:hypothetical protein [Piscinibacter sp.]|uniref:hypothetical protein n=1 Tax=Piscinibacter sp. TaxID=1903157 RepID=UPI002CB35275|nr:hypothetical protein [Albitalea sp.]HUG23743.1 hypothetical protein [Albitalea sp.]